MPAGEVPANKTKTKKLIIFGFFLINIQTGPAGSSTSEGEREKKEEKTLQPTPTDTRSLAAATFPLSPRSWVSLLSGVGRSVSRSVSQEFPHFYAQEGRGGVAKACCLGLFSFWGGDEEKRGRPEEQGDKKKKERERWQEGRRACDSGN